MKNALSIFLLLTVGCQPMDLSRNQKVGNLTLGSVQIRIENNKTTKAQILEWFGAPNIATTDKDGEMWNYTRQGTASQISTSSLGAWLLIGSGSMSNNSGMTSSYSFDLLIRFNKQDIVTDNRVIQTAF